MQKTSPCTYFMMESQKCVSHLIEVKISCSADRTARVAESRDRRIVNPFPPSKVELRLWIDVLLTKNMEDFENVEVRCAKSRSPGTSEGRRGATPGAARMPGEPPK